MTDYETMKRLDPHGWDGIEHSKFGHRVQTLLLNKRYEAPKSIAERRAAIALNFLVLAIIVWLAASR